MFICESCAKAAGGWQSIIRSWGTCEMCGRGGQICFDIPASRLPFDEARVIEVLFTLARERRLIAATHEADELACQDEEIARVITGIPEQALPSILAKLVIMSEDMSHAFAQLRNRR
jgi:hypothetical protein